MVGTHAGNKVAFRRNYRRRIYAFGADGPRVAFLGRFHVEAKSVPGFVARKQYTFAVGKPSSPKMIDGIPARSSIAMPIGLRRRKGQSSVKKIAMPKADGTAIAMAMIEVTIVPYIGAIPPNFSVTGFHTCDV